MALFKYDNANAGYPQCLLLHGSFVVPSTVANNLQIIPSLLPLGQPRTPGAQVSATVNPLGVRVNVFAGPFGGAPGAATNIAQLPAGIPTGGVTSGSEFLLDLTGFPADIVSCEVDICRQSRNAVNNDVQCSMIDNVNKLIFIQSVLFTTGAATAPPAGSLISFMVALKDTIGV